MKAIRRFCPLFLIAGSISAQELNVNSLPNDWQAQVYVEECTTGGCTGKGNIHLYNKGGASHRFESADLGFNMPLSETWQIDGTHENSPIQMDDFNFDGKTDVAIRNGNTGNYGAAGYDIYVQTASGRFVESKELNELVQGYAGLFTVDHDHKILRNSGRNGCCFVQEFGWSIPQGKKPQLVEKLTWESLNDGRNRITTEKLVNGKWHKKVHYER